MKHPMPVRLLPLIAVVLVSAGCSRSRDVADASLESLVTTPTQASWSALAPQAALVRLPGLTAASVREKRSPQGMTQEIALAGRQGGRIALSLTGDDVATGLYPGKPSERGIKTELAAEFPGKTFRVVTQPRRNAYGPYGLAVSASGGERCVYAWQWLDGQQRRIAEELGGTVSWRARLCRSNQSLDDIAAALDLVELAPRSDVIATPLARAVPAKARRAHVRATHRPASTAQIQVPRQHVSDSSRLYLAPLEGSPDTRGVVPSPALDTSLPAAAYRGPQTRAAIESAGQVTTRTAVAVPAPH